MKIKSAKAFRKWYKDLTPARKHASRFWDENFIGAQHNNLSGFFSMYHGDKEQVYDFLRKEVEMAEDGQAIYEFVQNAADSDSTQFYMFYDKKHLVVINNGVNFTKEGVKSILNIGQSHGKLDPDKIGRYGIGFKLTHRLVGKSSGLDELLNVDNKGYRGPVLFSWSDKLQLDNFMEAEDFDYVDFEDASAPWLLKILVTNFPAQPEEKVKGVEFEETRPFSRKEVSDFQSFIKSFREKIDMQFMDTGTIFFLKLGEKKFEYLEKQQQEYINGLSTSMHFLKSVDKLTINDTVVHKDNSANNVLEFIIENGSNDFKNIGLTELRDKKSAAKFKICFADNSKGATELKRHPNIYKFFPAAKEVNNLSFVIHSNLFELSSNRQNLTETPINKALLKLLSRRLIEKMEWSKSHDRNLYLNLFTSIVMSDEPPSSSSGNGWQNSFFYDNLLAYIRTSVPTKGGFSDNLENVKINNVAFYINLKELGLDSYHWFEWDLKTDESLVYQAIKKDKLGLEIWDVRDVVENANQTNFNLWIQGISDNDYKEFIDQLENAIPRNKTKEALRNLNFLKFSDGGFKSPNTILSGINNSAQFSTENLSSHIFLYEKTKGIADILKKLGFHLSDLNISSYPNICSFISELKESQLYNLIANQCKENNLLSNEKESLFLNLTNEATKFSDVGDVALKKLELFCNEKSDIKPLTHLISPSLSVAQAFNKYKIQKDEYFQRLNTFLVSDSESLFKNVYLNNQNEIISEFTEQNEIIKLIELYQEVDKNFFSEFIIKQVNSSYQLIFKNEDLYQVQSGLKLTREFIEQQCTGKLYVLPYAFVNFREELGIVKSEELHLLLLDYIDINRWMPELVDIVSGEAKTKLIDNIESFELTVGHKYDSNSYEYKLLDIACSKAKSINLKKFQSKIKILKEGRVLQLPDIPPYSDDVELGEFEFRLSKLLPNEHNNGDVISNLIALFDEIGLSEEKLNLIFGISQGSAPEAIFNHLLEKYSTLENSEQLYFVLRYGIETNVSIDQFKVATMEGESKLLDASFYLTSCCFIDQNHVLGEQYEGITKRIKEKLAISNTSSFILSQPYFDSEKFHCPHLKSELNEKEKLEFIEFIYSKWQKDLIRPYVNIETLTEFGDNKIADVLGFDPKYSVFSVEYALENELLPEYFITWVSDEAKKLAFAKQIGIWTEQTVVTELRKHLSAVDNEFSRNLLHQEPRFNDDEKMLFNTFEWLKENSFTLSTDNQFESFKTLVEIINRSRPSNNGDLLLEVETDFETLENISLEWDWQNYLLWKENTVEKFNIYIVNQPIQKVVRLDEIEEYTFYQFNRGNEDIKNNDIYVYGSENVRESLHVIATDNQNDFSFEHIATLFNNDTEENRMLKDEIAKLKKQLQTLPNAKMGTGEDDSLSKSNQDEVSREAREIVKEELEKQGFVFTNGIGTYSTITGVFKDGLEFPLVVKSYKSQEEPFKIGANEWIHLSKDNSMLWVHFGNRKLGVINFGNLIRKQDRLTISFDTNNINNSTRINDFAKLLNYFTKVHFEFNDINPDKYSVSDSLADYRFNEQGREDDLTADSDQIL